MKKTILILIFMLGLMTVANAQKARQLYLGYENDDVIVPDNDSANKKTPDERPDGGQPGAKVTIERLRNGKLEFVSPKSKFRSGDKIRLRFATNFDGYIRILNVGSSGRVTMLFPYKGADERITPSNDFQVPNNAWIVFDDTEGTEMLSVILSKKPFDADDDLKGLNDRATNSRDLTIESDDDATYAVGTEESFEKPIGFTLRLKHKKYKD